MNSSGGQPAFCYHKGFILNRPAEPQRHVTVNVFMHVFYITALTHFCSLPLFSKTTSCSATKRRYLYISMKPVWSDWWLQDPPKTLMGFPPKTQWKACPVRVAACYKHLMRFVINNQIICSLWDTQRHCNISWNIIFIFFRPVTDYSCRVPLFRLVTFMFCELLFITSTETED